MVIHSLTGKEQFFLVEF